MTARRRVTGSLLLRYALLVVTTVVTVGPFLWQLSTSLKGAGDAIYGPAATLLPTHPTLANYAAVADVIPLWRYAGNSLLVAGASVVTNCLFGAVQSQAAAQGTMNNLTFGNQNYQYYETICSGAPAGPGYNGADAVHTHMTNSRLTDPEILESRFPVVLEDFHIRVGSGGRGQWNAGNGTKRTIRARETLDFAILSGHRRIAPFGIKGGSPGELGRNLVRRNDGRTEELPGCAHTILEAGEAFTVVTPTGGGYGRP